MDKIKVGIMGGAGYTGGELLRLLIHHDAAEIIYVHSRSHADKLVSMVHTDLLGDTPLIFTDKISDTADVVFLCLGHGESKKRIHEIAGTVKVIDLSQDFRLENPAQRSFVYGLPELNRDAIKKANNIANPGCFATSIQLALLPLAQTNLLQFDVTAHCTTGSTGAGQALTETSHFSWRQNNLSVYKAFTHQHLAEITKSIQQLQPDYHNSMLMFPQRGSFTRGILACLSVKVDEPIETLIAHYKNYYSTHPFVHISENAIDLKQVVNTNKCLLYLEKHKDQLMIVSIIDNLLKGASGQAVQNMNLLFGLDETTGLKLKASAF
jgi:N-acetyl-gamma-glutamyl-phosphate reductase